MLSLGCNNGTDILYIYMHILVAIPRRTAAYYVMFGVFVCLFVCHPCT